MFYNKETKEYNSVAITFTVIIFSLMLIGICMWVFPIYNVWSAGQKGQAEFSQAEQNRRIKILEAEAKKDSAKLNAEAEIERAKGVQRANAIIADGLKGHEEYLRYLWITGLENEQNTQVIYIPTEAGLPILEAGKR